MSNLEQTLSIIKPDAVERNLENEIKVMFKSKGFSIIKEKKIQIEKSEAEKFYKVHETKPFYNDLCSYLSSGPIVVMVLEKENSILANRKLMGATNPKAGTVTSDIASAIKEFKAGKLEFRADKAGIVHVRFGKASFTENALFENLKTLQESIDKNKPSGAKGKYWKSFYVTSTMGPSVQVDVNALQDYQPES